MRMRHHYYVVIQYQLPTGLGYMATGAEVSPAPLTTVDQIANLAQAILKQGKQNGMVPLDATSPMVTFYSLLYTEKIRGPIFPETTKS